jgi:uncharacterized coiled-coil DUF342 family protein
MITTQLELCSLQSAQVDHLGRLLAEIADLQKQADQIKDSIKDLASTGGATSYEGRLFKATYSESNRNSVDYKALCSDLNISKDLLAKYTKQTAVFTVKVTSR